MGPQWNKVKRRWIFRLWKVILFLRVWVEPQNPEPFVEYVLICSAREIYSIFYQHKFTTGICFEKWGVVLPCTVNKNAT